MNELQINYNNKQTMLQQEQQLYNINKQNNDDCDITGETLNKTNNIYFYSNIGLAIVIMLLILFIIIKYKKIENIKL
jgi:hypothetical protein